MGNCKDCKDNKRDTCFGRKSASCVDYYGCLSDNTSLDEEKCYDMEEVLCESFNLIDELFDRIDVSHLGCCLDYTVDDEKEGLSLSEVLSSFEGVLCDHEERLNKIDEPNVNEGCAVKDECGEPISKCVTFEYAGFGTGDVVIDNGYSVFKKLPGVGYSDLAYKIKRKGKAKVTVEVYGDSLGVLSVGLSKNNFEPLNTPLSQSVMSGVVLTTVFLEEVNNNDILEVKFRNISGNPTINTVKFVVEQI